MDGERNVYIKQTILDVACGPKDSFVHNTFKLFVLH